LQAVDKQPKHRRYVLKRAVIMIAERVTNIDILDLGILNYYYYYYYLIIAYNASVLLILFICFVETRLQLFFVKRLKTLFLIAGIRKSKLISTP